MRVLQALVAAVVVAGLAGAASAQSLGELAAKEKQKRQGKPAPKVITEDDLARAGTRGTLSVTGDPAEAEAASTDPAANPDEAAAAPADGEAAATPAGNKPGAKKEKTPAELEAERRAEWQKKFDLAKQKVGIYQGNVDRIQTDLNDLSAGVYTDRHRTVLKMFDEEKAKLAAAQAELATLDEEGRRNGWPR